MTTTTGRRKASIIPRPQTIARRKSSSTGQAEHHKDSIEFVYTSTTMEYIYPPSSQSTRNFSRTRKEYAPINYSYVKHDEFSVNHTSVNWSGVKLCKFTVNCTSVNRSSVKLRKFSVNYMTITGAV